MKTHSIFKAVFVFLFVALFIIAEAKNSPIKTDIGGLIAGIALIQSWVILEYETKK